eukprot:m.164833 g.164833  ORF g.164833 m.164833 type:complete len:215 (+) comp9888_c1_seq6:182-826(+)
MADKSERPVYKVVVVGDSATGKTSFIKRLCLGHFTESYRATIGTDFAAKAMKIKEKELLLQLWDIAGQDRIRNVTHVFYRNAAAAIVMCDWANMSTLEGATVWKKDIADKVLLADGTPLPCFLLVNKSDLRDSTGPSDKEIDDFCRLHSIASWAPVSAKTGSNIHEIITAICELLLRPPPAPPGPVATSAVLCPKPTSGLRLLKDMLPRSKCGC